MAARQRAALSWIVLPALLLASCASAQTQRSEWVLTGPADGTTLEVAVFAGHSSCLDRPRVELVDQGPTRVEIHGLVDHTGDDACTDDWGVQAVTVELDEPLGDRELTGCAGDEVDWHGWRFDADADADCTEVRDDHL